MLRAVVGVFMPLAFSQFLLTLDDRVATLADLAPLKGHEGAILTVESTDYHIKEVKEINSNCFWVYIRFGTSSPRADDVYNKTTTSMEENPRTMDQSELKGQLFIVYDSDRSTLYVSNAKKKGFIQKAIKQEIGIDVEIKNVLLDVDEFIERAKIIQEVKLVRENNLINSIDETFSQPTDCYGLGMPHEATISAVFGRPMTERFKGFLRQFKAEKNALRYKGLVCVGRDDRNFEFTFNVDTFQQKINLAVQKEKNGLYNVDAVRVEMATRLLV